MVERMLAWGSLGAVCGVVLGFGNGVTYVAPGIPDDPWMKEFYAVHVMHLMSLEGVVGGLIGAVIALSIPAASVRRRTFAFTACGAALGGGIGWILARLFVWRGDPHVVSNLISQAAGGLVGFVLSMLRQAAGSGPSSAGSSDV